MIVLIPAYEPGAALVDLVAEIATLDPGQRVVVVDDGSGAPFRPVFDAVEALGAVVLRHAPNQGKGHALKAGFRHIALRFPGQAVVCADCDGQHRLEDIVRVASALDEERPMVLGVRAFTGTVPLRSRFGNAVTRVAFTLATGRGVSDTQTGLRAYRPELLGWLDTVDGRRFEYELNALLAARTHGITITEVPIATVYLDHNESSHFRPLVDSARIYAPLLRFAASSLAAFAVDFVVFVLLMTFGAGLATSVVTARLISASFNFTANHRFVFGHLGNRARSAARYGLLAASLLLANYLLLRGLIGGLGIPAAMAKLMTEFTLFSASYVVQRRFVFPDRSVCPNAPEPKFAASPSSRVAQ